MPGASGAVLLPAAVVFAMGVAFAALLLVRLTAAPVLDATGAFALPVHPITPSRALALPMVAGGLVPSRL